MAGISVPGVIEARDVVSPLVASSPHMVSLVSGASVDINFLQGNHFTLTLSHSATLANPTLDTGVAGASGMIEVKQDAVGGRTLAYDTMYNFDGGTPIVLGAGADGIDLIGYFIMNYKVDGLVSVFLTHLATLDQP